MNEFIVIVSSFLFCLGNGSNHPCYEKIEIKRNGNRFEIVQSTIGFKCDIEGHSWIWKYGTYGFHPVSRAMLMICSYCGAERKIKKIERKRECLDIEEVWEDNNEKIERPPDQNKFPFGLQPL